MTTRNLFRGLWAVAALIGIGLSTPTFAGDQSVAISNGTIAGIQSDTLSVTMNTDAPTEGFVLAVGYDDTSLVSVTDVSVIGTDTAAAGAELVVAEIFDAEGGFTLGVVLDSTGPFDGQTIPAGASTIATFDVTADAVVVVQTDITFDFVDGTFNDPVLNNILVQGGASVSFDDLNTTPGILTLDVPPPDSLTIEDVAIAAGETGCARILMNNQSGAVQGFVLSIAHPLAAVTLEAITLTDTVTDAAGAEFVVSEIDNDVLGGGTLAVVLDFNSPFNGQTIPVAADNHIANFCYSCNNPPVLPDPPVSFDLEFVNGVFGTPALDNVIVVGGLSLFPELINGQVTCLPSLPEDTEYFCGARELDEFGQVQDVIANPDSIAEVCVFYIDPTDNLQGFQIAMCLPKDSEKILEFVEESFTVEGTILDEVGTEFLNQSQDNDPNDGDGVEQTVGILLDALPPFDDQTVPQTAFPLLVGCFQVRVDKRAKCDTCYEIDFCDGVNGSEALPVDNVVVANFQSIQDFKTNSCAVCVEANPEFIRSDCNLDEKVNIADAAAMLGAQFQNLVVGCQDACDANDDGKVNLADTVFTLNYLFKSGDLPPDPGPMVAGPDPTADELGCEMGLNPCL